MNRFYGALMGHSLRLWVTVCDSEELRLKGSRAFPSAQEVRHTRLYTSLTVRPQGFVAASS